MTPRSTSPTKGAETLVDKSTHEKSKLCLFLAALLSCCVVTIHSSRYASPAIGVVDHRSNRNVLQLYQTASNATAAPVRHQAASEVLGSSSANLESVSVDRLLAQDWCVAFSPFACENRGTECMHLEQSRSNAALCVRQISPEWIRPRSKRNHQRRSSDWVREPPRRFPR